MVIQRLPSTPLAKDVLYIGSAVPLETSEGLEAVQQPLRSRYPVDNDDNIQGILATLTIVPSGIQLRYKNDPGNIVLFPFSALTMCAAVRCVRTSNAATNEVTARFVSLSSPEAGGINNERPAIFTAITRRTKGRQVLECHGFITMSPKDAMELVQWTSVMDKRSKQSGSTYSTLGAGVTMATYESSKVDTSFRDDTASLPDFPIQLVPGEPMVLNTSPAFYKEPPPSGYFYSTKDAQVKKYALHKFSGGGGATTVDDTQSMIQAATDTLERRPGYAGSHYSASAVMAPSRQPIMVPLRPYLPPPPAYVRPVTVRPPPPHDGYFGETSRSRGLPLLSLCRHMYYEGDLRPRPRNRSSSSRSSSSSSSSGVSGRAKKKGHVNRTRDGSSGSDSRPVTPPTDYDSPRGPRISRREDFVQRQHHGSELNGYTSRKGYLPGPPGPGYYMVAPTPYGYYGTLPGTQRPRSVPPYGDKTGTKKKDKKSKKTKKVSKKDSKKRSSAQNHDTSTDSLAGYASELAPNGEGKQPRDFRRLENQFKHERAFSKSLTEETRHSVRGDAKHDAYTLNHSTAQNENDFPMY
ncbi:unnamed protein product [Lymnaea stagnalis]|uniref:PID domain-containing protein n=1 Tax=Lymnaea stagnalis TaxID=6523 RepID=A0AAV2ICB7_LYMST